MFCPAGNKNNMTGDGPYLPSYLSPINICVEWNCYSKPPTNPCSPQNSPQTVWMAQNHPSKITSILQVFHSGLAGRRITGPKFYPRRRHHPSTHIHTTLLDTPPTRRDCWFLPYRILSFCPCWKLGSRNVCGWGVRRRQGIRWDHLAGFAVKREKGVKRKEKKKFLFFWAGKTSQTKRKKKIVLLLLLFLLLLYNFILFCFVTFFTHWSVNEHILHYA